MDGLGWLMSRAVSLHPSQAGRERGLGAREVLLAAEVLLLMKARGEEMGSALCSWPESKAWAAKTCQP